MWTVSVSLMIISIYFVCEAVLSQPVTGGLPWRSDAQALHRTLRHTLMAAVGCFFFGFFSSYDWRQAGVLATLDFFRICCAFRSARYRTTRCCSTSTTCCSVRRTIRCFWWCLSTDSAGAVRHPVGVAPVPHSLDTSRVGHLGRRKGTHRLHLLRPHGEIPSPVRVHDNRQQSMNELSRKKRR